MNPDLPGYRSPQEYRGLANDLYNNPNATVTEFPNNSPLYAGEGDAPLFVENRSAGVLSS
jgi:hypothetical protein